MSHDPRHSKAAAARLGEAREAHRRAYEARVERCRREVPGLAELDRRIQGTMGRVVAAALKGGTDPAEAVERARQENLELRTRRLELLRAHGVDPAELEDTPCCPLCGDTGWVDGARCRCFTEACAGENLRELSRQLDREKMRFENFSLERYSAYVPGQRSGPRICAEVAFSHCKKLARQFPDPGLKSLYLYGDTGLGKTLLSGCVAFEVAERGYWTVYETAHVLFDTYRRARFEFDSDAQREQVERYERCDLLVLDDLGSEGGGVQVTSALYQLVNQRLIHGLRTVISSNLDMGGVAERYSPQVASRLKGEYQALPLIGEDLRAG